MGNWEGWTLHGVGYFCKAFANHELLSTEISMCLNWEGGVL